MSQPMIEILRHRKSGDFVLVNYAENKALIGSIASGDLIQASQSDVRIRGLELVLDNLQGYSSRDYRDGSEVSRFSRTEHNAFEKDFAHVGITHLGDRLEITPMIRQPKGGFISQSADEIILDLPVDNATFVKALEDVCEKC